MKMGRVSLLSVLLIAVLLAACTPAAPGTPQTQVNTPVSEGTPTTAATLAATATVAAAEPEAEPTQTQFTASGPASCTVVSSMLPTPNPTETAFMPPVTQDDWAAGPEDAAVTFIEYSDFQCPYCAQLEPVLTQLEQDFPEDLRVVFRHFPLSFHDKALLAAYATEAAGKQGMFQEMKNHIFAEQLAWSEQTPEEFETWVKAQAAEMGLDEAQFAADLSSEESKARVQADLEEGEAINVPGTPYLIINGVPYQGPRDYFNLSTIIKLYVMEEQQFTECPEMVIDPDAEYTATFETEKGEVVFELFPKQAPFTVNNFVFLAREGWYDGVSFHRVLPGFVAQGGDPSGTGYGSPGYAYGLEVTPELRFDQPGLLAMANAGPDANGSQFFVTYAPLPNLDGKFTIFGRVLSGMDVLEQLQERDPQQGGNLPEGDIIHTITIEEK